MDNHHVNSRTPQAIRRLKIALAIICTLVLFEVIGGLLSGSLALLGDAGHMLVDALALGLAWFAMSIAGRPATANRTYGYHRVEIMAALVNGIILLVVAIYIFYEACQRFLEPPAIQISIMLPVAGVGLIANVIAIMLLRKSSKHNARRVLLARG